MTFGAAIVLGYLLGAIPFGLLLTRLAGLGDIRQIGSGNIGATNVLRTGNKPLALATLILDAGKGGFAYLLALYFMPEAALFAGTASFIGHLYPVYLGFRGGKGVATYLGFVLAVSPLVGVLVCCTWLIAALVFRFSSLAALVAVACAPVYAFWLTSMEFFAVSWGLGLMITWAHRANIKRLAQGSEPKIGRKSGS